MIKALFLFPKSTEPEMLEGFLSTNLIPTLQQSSGLRSLTTSTGPLMSPGGPPPYAKVVEASFGSLEDWIALVQSPAVQARRDDMPPDTLILYYEVDES
jgi:hypothetical protein